MLQPVQLTDVSIRYADEIAELRDFLIKAGCTVQTNEALGEIAARIRQDRNFHRDLTSYVWVVLDRCDRISYSDLLGVLAIAAAGPTFAATADEDDAHWLLRFLMQARHSLSDDLDAPSDYKDRAPAHVPADVLASLPIEPIQPSGGTVEAASVARLRPVEAALFTPEEPEENDSRRRGYLWVVAAACLLVAVLLGGWWLKIRPANTAGIAPASVSPAVAGNVSPAPTTQESVPASATPSDAREERTARAAGHSPDRRRSSRATRSGPVTRSSPRMPVPAPYVSAPAASVPPPVTASATHGPTLPAYPPAQAPPTPAPITRTPESGNTPAPVNRAAGNAGPTQVGPHGGPSSVTLPQNTAHPQNSTPQGGESISRNSKPPIILHRREAGSSPGQDGTEFALTNPASVVSAPRATTADGSTQAAPVGVVRLTSLGVMASNLVYSPLPAYPAAASASHVQGEVKLSADVDRDGKVAAVRVISGPPLLRAAALDAVQRWRYRPYASPGGPITMAAIEVLDFQLP